MKITTLTRPFQRTIIWYKAKTKKTKIIIAVITALVLLLLIQAIANANKAPTYKTEVVKKATITETVVETGTITASGRSDVYSPTTGVVEEIYVGNNDQVVLNQDLFLVRSNASDEQKATAYAAYQSAYSSLKTAEQAKLSTQALLEQNRQAVLDAQNKVNYKNTNEKNPATGSNYTELEKQSLDSALTSARETFTANEKKYNEVGTSISAAQAQANAAWLSYQATQNVIVKAPTVGVIANLAVAPGGSVQAQTLTATGTTKPVLAIGSFTVTEVAVGLNETDSAKVSPGQEAKIEVSSLDRKTYDGTVTRVDSIGTDTQGVVQYNAYITVQNADAEIKSGMTADVTITTKMRRNVLTVPNSAVKPYQGGRAVRVLDPKNNELKFIKVQIGIRGEERTEILKGIPEGTQVVTALPNDQINRPSLF